MSKYVQLSLLCLCVSLFLGCGGGGEAPPTAEEAAANDAKMEAEMATMMKQLPQKPK